THREPAFRACQRCDERGVMEGRLCGEVVSAENRALRGCQVLGAYRIRFDPGASGGEGEVAGTFEGVIICPCREAGGREEGAETPAGGSPGPGGLGPGPRSR